LTGEASSPPVRRERLDKFLFHARAVKSRTLAQKLIVSGAVRINSERTESADRKVGPGDVLTMQVHEQVLVWRIIDTGTRRGPAPEARALYEDLSPPRIPRAEQSPFDRAVAERPAGAGRPTKKERRETDRLRTDDHED
jgi:ribosome-associated heat shock protein Hsp15